MFKVIRKIIVILLLLAPIATASFISMTTTVDTTMREDVALISVETKNFGDESAYNVQITIEVEDLKNSSETENVIGVRQAFETNLSLSLSSLDKPGTYPLIVRVDYTDANGYPFSAITPSTVAFRQSTSSDVFATLGESTMTEDGETLVRVKVRNLDTNPKTVQIHLVTPKELSTEGGKTVELKGQSESEVSFRVKSFGALAGSTYAILAVVEYENDLHYSSIARGTVKITKAGNILLDNWFLIVVLIVLVAAVVLYQFKGRWMIWKRKPSSESQS